MLLFATTGPILMDQYLIRDSSVVLGSILKLIIGYVLLCYNTLALIGSSFIDTATCPQVLLQIVCGTYPDQNRPVGLRKITARFPAWLS